MKSPCPRCGLSITGSHATAEDCVRHIAPRYALAQAALKAMHARFRTLEDRCERLKVQERVARRSAQQRGDNAADLAERVTRLERLLGDGMRPERVA